MTAGEEGPQGISLPRATNDVKTALGGNSLEGS